MTRLAIDFGSCLTKIYMLGCGVVLAEATCVAVEEYSREGQASYYIKSLGNKARALSGRAAKNTHIVNPVFEGDIVNEVLAAELLKYFLEKVEIPPRKARKCEVIFLLPCGDNAELKQKYLNIAEECGIGKVYFTQTPYAAVLGHNASLTESLPVFCVDIGYGITNVASFSLDGMISGMSINLGGGNIDVHVMDYMAENCKLRVGALTAEKIKNTVGSLYEDDNKLIVADGRDVESGAPASVAVNSSGIYELIKLYVDKIVEYVNLAVKELPAEVASNVMHGGVYLSGGLCKMDGFYDYFSNAVKMPVNCPEEPQYAAVIGAGMILASDYLLERLADEG